MHFHIYIISIFLKVCMQYYFSCALNWKKKSTKTPWEFSGERNPFTQDIFSEQKHIGKGEGRSSRVGHLKAKVWRENPPEIHKEQ